MDYSISHIIEEINKSLKTDCNFKSEKVITSGKDYFGWVRKRLIWEPQVIINAVKCHEEDLPHVIRKIEFQLTEEFRTFSKIDPMVFKYTNIELLEQAVVGVVAYFGVSAEEGEILQDLSGKGSGKIVGCIILTSIALPRIGM